MGWHFSFGRLLQKSQSLGCEQMSHRLSHVQISNFKCIKTLSLELDHVTPLVGQNNAGKSTILSAIQWLVKPSALDENTFRNKGVAIEVQATVEGLNNDLIDNQLDPKHAPRIKKFLDGEKIIIKRVMPAGETKVSSAKLWLFNPETKDFEENPTGISSAIQDLFPDPVRIEAMTDANADAATNKATTTLGKLIAQLSAPVAAQHKDEIADTLLKLENLLSSNGSSRSEKLKEFDRDVTEMVQSFFPGLALNLHFPTPQPFDLFKNGTVKVSENGADERNFNELGHGAQRAIQMALIRFLAERVQSETEVPRCTLLLIDEPELYLHPHAIEQVRCALAVLSSHGYQVIYSTHSPLMIGRSELEVTNIVTKPDIATGTTVNVRAKDAIASAYEDTAEQARTLFDFSNAKEIWFARKLLLVEGHGEAEIMSYLYEGLLGRTMAFDRIGLVKLSGSGDMVKSLKILQNMGLEACGLVDLDYAYRTAVRASLIDANHPSRISAIAWFKANEVQHGIDLDSEGLPTKKSTNGSEGTFRLMAQDPLNHPGITTLHEDLKNQGIWLWTNGCLEDVLGIESKKNRQEVAKLCTDLSKGIVPTGLNQEHCGNFLSWVSSTVAE